MIFYLLFAIPCGFRSEETGGWELTVNLIHNSFIENLVEQLYFMIRDENNEIYDFMSNFKRSFLKTVLAHYVYAKYPDRQD